MVKIFGTVNGKSVRFKNIKDMRDYPFKLTDEILLIFGGRFIQSLTSYKEIKEYKMPAYERYGYPRGFAKRQAERRNK